MTKFEIDGRTYRTDGVLSEISGRLAHVEYFSERNQRWQAVKYFDRRMQIQAMMEDAA